MVASERRLTADDLGRTPEPPTGERLELVQGEIIEMSPPSILHGLFASRLDSLLRPFVKSRRLGEVFVESGYLLERDPDTVRGPDVSFVSATRIPPEGLPQEGFFPGAPDLAVEIVSPSDLDSEVQARVADYLDHGTRRVWVVRPQRRTVAVHYPDGTSRLLGMNDRLSGEDVLPDFDLPLADLFA